MEVKTINDYYEQLQERFPEVDPKDIQRIVQFGWKSLYLHNSYGGDVLLSNHKLWCYFGYLTKDSLKHVSYYIKKLIIKLRVLYKRYNTPFNGFYYFGLSEEEYQKQYASLINKKGRKRKWFTFTNIALYKIFDECKLKGYGFKYFFRVPYPEFLGYRRYKEELTTDSVELIEIREIPKFKDILVTNYDYDLL